MLARVERRLILIDVDVARGRQHTSAHLCDQREHATIIISDRTIPRVVLRERGKRGDGASNSISYSLELIDTMSERAW